VNRQQRRAAERERGLRWDDVVINSDASWHREVPRHGSPQWHADLDFAQRHMSFTRSWEQGFLASISRRHALTPKQKQILVEIAEALRRRGFA
jgi:hypothetical protein